MPLARLGPEQIAPVAPQPISSPDHVNLIPNTARVYFMTSLIGPPYYSDNVK